MPGSIRPVMAEFVGEEFYTSVCSKFVEADSRKRKRELSEGDVSRFNSIKDLLISHHRLETEVAELRRRLQDWQEMKTDRPLKPILWRVGHELNLRFVSSRLHRVILRRSFNAIEARRLD